jgi:hypothetical protein
VTIQGAGKDTKGRGAASATVVAEMTPLDAGRTSVSLQTNLALSGRIAQFGGSIINEIASLLIEKFVVNLNSAILVRDEPDETPAAAGVSAPAPADNQPRASAGPAPATRATASAAVEAAPLDLGALLKPVLTRYALIALFTVVVFALGFAAGRYF